MNERVRPPLAGLVLSGLTGAGKSTLQSSLLAAGCWTPLLVTSRAVDPMEGATIEHAERRDIIESVRNGDLVAPVIFGGHLYAWPRHDFARLRGNPEGAILSTRPYTALLLSASIPKLLPVWLDVAEEDRRRRLTQRGSARDQDPTLARSRLERDAEDNSYRELFSIRIQSDEVAFSKLIRLLEARAEQSES